MYVRVPAHTHVYAPIPAYKRTHTSHTRVYTNTRMQSQTHVYPRTLNARTHIWVCAYTHTPCTHLKFQPHMHIHIHPPRTHTRTNQVKKILSLGDTDPSAADNHGMTPLHYAAASDNKQIVKVIQKQYANDATLYIVLFALYTW